jgi:glutamine synthetase
MVDMAGKDIIPAVAAYEGDLANSILAIKEAGATATAQVEILNDVDGLLSEAKKALNTLNEVEAKAAEIADAKEQAFYYKDTVKPAMEALRAPIDKLEMMVDGEIWPIPTYGDLMFEV